LDQGPILGAPQNSDAPLSLEARGEHPLGSLRTP
jgi:hypothetical protein